MHIESPIKRRQSTRIYVGNVPIGDGAPIAVQSMTNTLTTDVAATVAQIQALEKVGGEVFITADHGNAEQMTDPDSGQTHTAHTTNPVPFVYVGRCAQLDSSGDLADVAPTMLAAMGLSPSAEMSGHSLLHLTS